MLFSTFKNKLPAQQRLRTYLLTDLDKVSTALVCSFLGKSYIEITNREFNSAGLQFYCEIQQHPTSVLLGVISHAK